ncbi:MAG: hypothetical protein Q8N88_04655, partial [Nanoarchaeota archaeon]|nr:hypothetical protein [Nanoarchaeota archaeon]
EVYQCSNGCSDGACLEENQTASCTDSDGGLNYYVKGNTTNVKHLGGNWDEEDKCEGNLLNEYYCEITSFEGSILNQGRVEVYQCSNGCSDGACLEENQTATCTDSDGGKDYFTNGVVYYKIDGEVNYRDAGDVCDTGNPCYGSDCKVVENYCSGNERNWEYYTCSNACYEGACVNVNPFEIESCSDFGNFIKNPKNFTYEDLFFKLDYNASYENSIWANDSEKNYQTNYASWFSHDDKYRRISFEVNTFDDGDDLNQWLTNQMNWEICKLDTYYTDEENLVYACNGNVLWDKDLKYSRYSSVDSIWVSGNQIISIYTSDSGYYDEEYEKYLEKQKMKDFIEGLKGSNQKEYIGWEYVDVSWPLRNIIEEVLKSCGSSIVSDTCKPSWTCKTEPTVCPQHGYQTRTCVENNCGLKPRTVEMDCSPGICAGCNIPKWFDYKDESKCIPYGTRFKQQTGWVKKLVEETEEESLSEESQSDEVSLKVLSSDEAILTVYTKNGNEENYTLRKNEKVVINASNFDDDLESFELTPIEIHYGSGNSDGFVNFRIKIKGWEKEAETVNAYCNYDGRVMQQKSVNKNGDWASCQNNYECESNFCTSGECVEITKMMKELSGWKVFGAKLACKVGHLLNIEKYNDCIGTRLGKSYLSNQ